MKRAPLKRSPMKRGSGNRVPAGVMAQVRQRSHERGQLKRFWAKTRQEGDCVVWTGRQSHNGYGRTAYGGGLRRLQRPAHRVAWELAHGPIGRGLYVCHKCDNRLCVRVDHLFLGTHEDNIRDADAKGRSRHPMHAPEVYKGIVADSARLSYREIATKHGVPIGTVSGVLWRHKKKRGTVIPTAVRNAVAKRSRGFCEVCYGLGLGMSAETKAKDCHHLVKRPRLHEAWALAHLCRRHHQMVDEPFSKGRLVFGWDYTGSPSWDPKPSAITWRIEVRERKDSPLLKSLGEGRIPL